jgi:hypothetical protein
MKKMLLKNTYSNIKNIITTSNKSSYKYKFNRNIFNVNKQTMVQKVDYTFDTRDFLTKVNEYENKLGDRDVNLNVNKETRIPGFATPEGTIRYSKRNVEEVHPDNFRYLYNTDIKISSIGLGTYIGPPDDLTDFYMYNSAKSCVLSGGVNHIDTAINYRYMRSEIAIGKAIRTLVDKYQIGRDELIIASKIGFVPEDAESGRRGHGFVQPLVEGNKISMEDIIFDDKKRPVHCMHPEYLKEQLDISLSNLGLESIDVMYLHNAIETQGPILPEELLNERLMKAFEFFVKINNHNNNIFIYFIYYF